MSVFSHTTLRSKVAQGTLWALIAKVITIISGGAIAIILARCLDPTTYGLLFLSISVINVSALLSDFGIGYSVSRYVAKYEAVDKSYLRNIVKMGLVYKALFGIAVTVLLIIFASTISSVIGQEELKIYLLIGGIAVFFKTLIDFSNKIFQGFQQLNYVTYIETLRGLCILLFVLGLVLLGYGGLGAICGYTISYIIVGAISVFIVLNRFYSKLQTSIHYISKEILHYAFPLMLINASFLIYMEMDTLMIGYFLSSEDVAFYRMPKEIIRMIALPAAAIGAAVAPALVHGKSSMGLNDIQDLVFQAHRFIMLLFIPASVALVILAKPIIIYTFGPSYFQSVIVLQLMSIYLLFFTIALIVSPSLDYLGHASIRSKLIIISALLNFVLNIFLIPKYGPPGAVFSTIFTYSIYVSINVYILSDELEMGLKQFISPISKVLLATFITSGYLLLSNSYIYDIITLLIVSVSGLVLYFCLAIFLKIISPAKLFRVISSTQS
jgi:O-antigen/teichoic acid export membrane protein